MKREAVAILLGIALGFLAGIGWRTHQATEAESRAHRADSLYQASQLREVLAQRERDAFDQLRAVAQRHADSLQSIADTHLVVVHRTVTASDANARARLAAAVGIEQQLAATQVNYQEAVRDRDNALLAADEQRRAVGRLQAMLTAGDTERVRERARGDLWKATADSLALANRDLLKHRRPAFNFKLGLGGFLAGALTATGVCVATRKCG